MNTFSRFDEKCLNWRKVYSERFLSFKKRAILYILLASSFYFIVYSLIISEKKLEWSGYIFVLVVFFIFAETLFLYDRIVSKFYPWTGAMGKRVIALFVFAIVFFVVANKIVPILEIKFLNPINDKEKYNLIMLVGFLYVVICVVGIIAHNFHESLKFFLFENEKLKQDKLISDYKALQDQLNPHFLFNNLSTLIAIIRYDPEKAIAFTESFTDVYRYVLTKEGQVAVTVREELVFIRSYIKLHAERTGGGIVVEIEVDEEPSEKKIPHLSLQVLVENSIKHNVTSRSKPLFIKIGVDDGRLYVYNTKQLKETTYSTHTGLSNLGKRLKILTDEELYIFSNNDFYKVTIPLID